ncbi:MAG: cryptochrome/photolyase family protein, partial [Segetibacter sp.]|nr:cryptochrome/photolyase family protein [Segetibacter sp.]
MNKQITLIFPHQLFKVHPAINKQCEVYMVEDHLYFRQYNFHKKKLLLHRASMKFYQQYLQDKNYTVKYIDAFSQLSALNNLFQQLRIDKIVEVNYCDTADYLLERRLKRYGNKNHIQLNKFDSPGFLNSQRDLQNYFGKTDHYFLHDFYKHERNRLSVLIKDNKPVGDRWSFDTENRKKLPKGVLPLPIAAVANDQYITEAQAYVQQHFPGNLGSESEFNFPVTYEDAEKRLDDFLKNRFDLFGPFQDAMQEKEPFLFHSVLSSSLNTGLITPDYVVDKVLQYAEEAKIPMPSLEGFIR